VSRQLAEARIARATAQDVFNASRLVAEFELLQEVGGDAKAVGSNDKDRERAYGLRCEGDKTFTTARGVLRKAEANVLLLEASLEGLKAARRERELAISERYLDLTGEKRGIFNLPHFTEMAS
jgi:hypothetical protein